MGFSGKTRLASGLFFLILGHLASAGTIEQNKLEITIFVYNSARVSVLDLAVAERQASMTFREAGIATEWVNCTAADFKACRPSGSTQFVLHIVAHGKTSTDAVFGLAFLGTDGKGRYCDVFYDRIEKMQIDSGANPGRLLGTVAAHEIGHLLLGSHSHSAMGLMSAHWGEGEVRRVGMRGLKFTTEQAGRMRYTSMTGKGVKNACRRRRQKNERCRTYFWCWARSIRGRSDSTATPSVPPENPSM